MTWRCLVGTVRALGVVVILLLMPGCQTEAPLVGIRVINDTRSTIMVTTLDGDGRLSPGATVSPGGTSWFGQSGCRINVRLRAFSAAGQQIQAKDGLCTGDTWHVTATATSAPPDH